LIFRSFIFSLLSSVAVAQSTPGVISKNTIEAFKELGYASVFSDQRLPSYAIPDSTRAFKYDSIWLEKLKETRSLFTLIHETTGDNIEKKVNKELLIDRFETINQKTPFQIAYNPILEREIAKYLRGDATLIRRMLQVSAFYFPLFEQILDENDLPLELKYLAIVESALDPKARSYVGAKGLWQFMYSTGKSFGLDVNNYVDDRSDPLKSTKAAAAYLKQLYQIFDNWDLALAAYNSGPGNVSKAIRRSGGHTNYWNIRPYLPKETADYVPRFYAILYLFEHAKKHGLSAESLERTYLETDTIHIKRSITFDHIAEELPITKDQLAVLNPSYRMATIPYVKGKDYALRLPKALIGDFISAEGEVYALAKKQEDASEKPLAALVSGPERLRYRVKSGDALSIIADRYGVSVKQIRSWNNLSGNVIRVGQRLTIYPRRYPKS
jgi:membrane-bound lytic murein transglycosylase D